jgi:hypothetical protein
MALTQYRQNKREKDEVKNKKKRPKWNEQGELVFGPRALPAPWRKILLKVTNFLQLTINWYIVIPFATPKAKIKQD